jgi:phage-related holin
MTPHRAPTLAGYAAGSLRSLAAVPVDAQGAIGAAIVASIGWAFGAANLGLLSVVLLAMLMDLIVGALRAVVDPLESFAPEKLYGGFVGKLFRILLIPTASLVDWLVIASPMPLPEGYETTFPVTAFVMYGLAAAELTSTLSKFKDGGVAPGLIAAVIRQLDRLKTGEEPPRRRHYDLPAEEARRAREEGRDA